MTAKIKYRGNEIKQPKQANKLKPSDESVKVCPVCDDILMEQVNSTNKNCVNCGETIINRFEKPKVGRPKNKNN
jgi:predicted RNA-binding Zn-ribbon protein involved in translation (DUF1610 family)